MPRLLYVTTVSATLRFLIPLAMHFRERGWSVDAMARGMEDSNEFSAAFDHTWEADWSRNPMDPRNLFSAAKHVRSVVSSGRYDIVHVHTPVAAFVTRYALRQLSSDIKPRIIYTAHGFHFHPQGGWLKNTLFQTLEKLGGRWTDYLVVINWTDKEAAKNRHIVRPEKIWYVPGIGVDLRRLVPNNIRDDDVKKVRQEMALAPGQPLLLMLAEFIPRKRHSDLIRAFARVARPNVHLALAGPGKGESETQRLAKSLGLEKRVHFLGFRRDVPALIRASTATILPSAHEGLSCSVMESLCLETPVIGSDIRGIRDLVGSDAGILVPLGDIEGLARAIERILDHPEEARAMGRCGRERMREFDLTRVVDFHERLYEHALRGQPHELAQPHPAPANTAQRSCD
jgi:glycosyltransferase involved in cell wall biosynthesis